MKSFWENPPLGEKSHPENFHPSKSPLESFHLDYSYQYHCLSSLNTLSINRGAGRVLIYILLPGPKFLISPEQLGVFSWNFETVLKQCSGNVETVCLFQLEPTNTCIFTLSHSRLFHRFWKTLSIITSGMVFLQNQLAAFSGFTNSSVLNVWLGSKCTSVASFARFLAFFL